MKYLATRVDANGSMAFFAVPENLRIKFEKVEDGLCIVFKDANNKKRQLRYLLPVDKRRKEFWAKVPLTDYLFSNFSDVYDTVFKTIVVFLSEGKSLNIGGSENTNRISLTNICDDKSLEKSGSENQVLDLDENAKSWQNLFDLEICILSN